MRLETRLVSLWPRLRSLSNSVVISMTKPFDENYDSYATKLLSGEFRNSRIIHRNLSGILRAYDEMKTEERRKANRDWQIRQYAIERAKRCEPF